MNSNQPNRFQAPTTPNPQSTNTPSIPQASPQLLPKKKVPWLLISIIFLLIGATGVLGYKYYELQQKVTDLQQPTPKPSPQLVVSSPSPVVSLTTEVDPAENWTTHNLTTFKNNYIGIQLKYPPAWTVINNMENPKTSYVASLGTPPNKKYRSEAEAFLNIQYLSNIDTFPSLELSATGRQQYVGGTEPQKATMGDIKGYIIEKSDGSGDYKEFIFSSKDKYVAISFPKDNPHQDAIQEILSTLKLIN